VHKKDVNLTFVANLQSKLCSTLCCVLCTGSSFGNLGPFLHIQIQRIFDEFALHWEMRSNMLHDACGLPPLHLCLSPLLWACWIIPSPNFTRKVKNGLFLSPWRSCWYMSPSIYCSKHQHSVKNFFPPFQGLPIKVPDATNRLKR